MAKKKPAAKAGKSMPAAGGPPAQIGLAAAGGNGGQNGLVVKRYFAQVAQNYLIGSVPTSQFSLTVVDTKDPNETPYVFAAGPISSGQDVVKQFWDTVETANWQTGWHFDADGGRNIIKIYP